MYINQKMGLGWSGHTLCKLNSITQQVLQWILQDKGGIGRSSNIWGRNEF